MPNSIDILTQKIAKGQRFRNAFSRYFAISLAILRKALAACDNSEFFR